MKSAAQAGLDGLHRLRLLKRGLETFIVKRNADYKPGEEIPPFYHFIEDLTYVFAHQLYPEDWRWNDEEMVATLIDFNRQKCLATIDWLIESADELDDNKLYGELMVFFALRFSQIKYLFDEPCTSEELVNRINKIITDIL